jgi:hypothetical protein
MYVCGGDDCVSLSHTSEQLELNYGLYKVIYFTAI